LETVEVLIMQKRALLSVYHKDGIVDFASGLIELGFEIISTGGTAGMLREAGLSVTDVAEVTGFPEMMDGRLKTLHPAILGGILLDRYKEGHVEEARAHGIEPIDLVCVNLYPFSETAVKPRVVTEEVIEMIDIGGPTMLRAAAKNHKHVIVVPGHIYYDLVLEGIREGGVSLKTRRELATTVFRIMCSYDRDVSSWFHVVLTPTS